MLIIALLAAVSRAAPASGETRAENEARAIALHAAMDANHDGFVTYDEVQRYARRFVPAAAPAAADSTVARQAFADADRDGDGRISRAEAIAGADRSFAAADTDGDGVLTDAERGAYAAKMLDREAAELRTFPPLPCRPGAACDVNPR